MLNPLLKRGKARPPLLFARAQIWKGPLRDLVSAIDSKSYSLLERLSKEIY
jgi:hypothetical protein